MIKYAAILMHAVLLATLLASSHGMLKWVSSQPHENYLQMLLGHWKAVVAALAVYGFIFFYYILVLRSSPVSILYPVYTGLSVLFVLIGRLVFSEPLTSVQVFGAGFVLMGIVLMGSGR
jgi:small multidrug resistance pump